MGMIYIPTTERHAVHPKKIVATFALLLAALTGCSFNSDSEGGDSIKGGKTMGADIRIFQYNGNNLYCIGSGHGLSCDWVRYHQDNDS